MLVLARKIGQSIMIGEDIEIKLLEITEGEIRLGITAPEDITIIRAEVPPKKP